MSGWFSILIIDDDRMVTDKLEKISGAKAAKKRFSLAGVFSKGA